MLNSSGEWRGVEREEEVRRKKEGLPPLLSLSSEHTSHSEVFLNEILNRIDSLRIYARLICLSENNYAEQRNVLHHNFIFQVGFWTPL
jgi:hypothetical protein